MKASEPNSNSVNLNDTMIKIIQTLENLKIKRDKINQDLEEGYQLREKTEETLIALLEDTCSKLAQQEQ